MATLSTSQHVTRFEILSKLAEWLFHPDDPHQTRFQPKVYLELGTGGGQTFNKLWPQFDVSIGVDINPVTRNQIGEDTDRWWLHIMPTVEFFEKHAGAHEYDLVFIDADHTAEAVLRDFHAIFPHVREGGYIVLHDTYPRNEAELNPHACGDAWKAAWELSRTGADLWEACTLANSNFYGLTLIRKRTRHLHWLQNGH